MKSGSKAHRCLLGLTALVIVFAACGRKEETPPPKPAAKAPAEEEKFRKLHILNENGDVAVTLRWGAEEAQVFFEEGENRRFLRSRLGKGRQRRWSERGAGPVALMRGNGEGNAFTLRSADGEKIWWRIRYGDRVALVRDNPELPGFDLRLATDNGVKVTREDGTELGQVTFDRKTKQVEVHDKDGKVVFKTAKNAPPSMLYGVLLVPDLEPEMRYILMAELLIR